MDLTTWKIVRTGSVAVLEVEEAVVIEMVTEGN
jgi:hypothetical protein